MSDTEQTEQMTADNDVGANGAAPDGGATTEHDLSALIAERDEYLEQLRRGRAEFANFRRRTEQERAQARELANQSLLAQLLPVVDDFARALDAIPVEQRGSSWVQGIGLIERKLWGVLERQGVTPVEALGQPFDPAQHEAIASDPGGDVGTVIEVYQPGYRLGQSLLRPAMVKVGPRPTPDGERAGGDSGAGAEG